MMTAAKTTTGKTANGKPTPSKAARKTAPSKPNGKATTKAQVSKAKADAEPTLAPEPRAGSEPEQLALAVAEGAADEQVAALVSHSPLYMDVLLEQAPRWFAHDPNTTDAEVRKRRATELLTTMLGLGGSQ